LSRDFWRSQPSIEKIDSCIINGNDVSELNDLINNDQVKVDTY